MGYKLAPPPSLSAFPFSASKPMQPITPSVGTLPARNGAPDWPAVDTCIAQWAPARLLVGLPYNMDGSDTTTTAACR